MQNHVVKHVGGPWDGDEVLLDDPREVYQLNKTLVFRKIDGTPLGEYRFVFVTHKFPFSGKDEVIGLQYQWYEADT